jgi:hypothetical protein
MCFRLKYVRHNLIMKFMLLCACWCFGATAHAQVYQCPGPSGPVFQQAPCAGGSKLQDKVEAPASPEPAASYVCPSDSDIREAETSAASTTLPVDGRIAKKALVIAMKKCPRKITCGEILKISPDKKTAYAAAQRYAKLFDPNKQPYLQLDRDRDGKSCQSYRKVS